MRYKIPYLNSLGPVLAYSGLIHLFSITYGFSYALPSHLLYPYFISGSILAALLTAILAISDHSWESRPEKLEVIKEVTWILAAVSVIATIYFHAGSNNTIIGAIAPYALACLALFRLFFGRDWTILFVAVLGTSVFIFLALSIPINVKAANMLPIISAGCQRIAQGQPAFFELYPDVASAPLYYLPGLVYPYCLLSWQEIDVRWLNILLAAAMAFIAIYGLSSLRQRPYLVMITLGVLLFSPLSLQMAYYGHIWLYWFLVCALGVAILNRRLFLAGFLLGLALGTRQTAAFLALPLMIYSFTCFGWKKTLYVGMVVVCTYLSIMLPIVLVNEFSLLDFYTNVKTTSDITHAGTPNPMDQISISGLLAYLGLREHVLFIQVIIAAVVSLFFLRSKRWDNPSFLVYLGVSYLLIISFSIFLHRYFYGPGLILVGLGLATRYGGANSSKERVNPSGK